MANTDRTQITREQTEFYDKNLLMRAVPRFVHLRWAQVRDLPRKGGTNQIKFRRYGNLTAQLTALTEGSTPAGSQLSITDVTATYAQYGDFVTIVDVIDFESIDRVLVEAGEIMGDQAGDTLDQLTRDVIVAGTSVSFGGNATSRATVDSSDTIDVAAVRTAVKNLKNNLATRILRMINPSTGISTSPVDNAYVGIVHPDVTIGLKAEPDFVRIEEYSRQVNIMEGEVGSLDEVRFVETTNAKIFSGAGSGGIDVYAVIILGMNAYGITRVSGEAMKNIIKPLGSAGSADPLDQRSTSGWKATFVAKILNNNFLTRIEVAAG